MLKKQLVNNDVTKDLPTECRFIMTICLSIFNIWHMIAGHLLARVQSSTTKGNVSKNRAWYDSRIQVSPHTITSRGNAINWPLFRHHLKHEVLV